MSGLYLEALHPMIAQRSCQHCQAFVYNEETGLVRNRPKPFDDQPLPRAANNPPPCRAAGLSCAKGTPEASREWSRKNRLAYLHYLGCCATGDWPDDGIVRRNAAILRRVEKRLENFDRWRDDQRHKMLVQIFAATLPTRMA